MLLDVLSEHSPNQLANTVLLIAGISVVAIILFRQYGSRRLKPTIVNEITIAEQKYFNGRPFPLVLSPNSVGAINLEEFSNWFKENRKHISRLLFEHKVILFRNFPVKSAENLDSVIQASGIKGMDYVGGAAVRTQLTSRVFTANESPSTENIPFHHEMSQVPEPPTHLFFFCETPAETGGETPILISSEVCSKLEDLHPEFMSKIEQYGVRYTRILPEKDDPTSAIGRGWKSTYLTETREEAEEKMREQNVTFEWLSDGSGNLKTTTAVLPAIRIDSGINRSNKKTFFNSMVAAYTGWNDSRNDGKKAVEVGDGTYCEDIVINDAVKVMEDICVAFKWQKGDVMFVDNRQAMHARNPFTGKRRILASLARDYDY